MTVYTLFGQTGGDALAGNAGGFTLGLEFSLSAAATITGYWWFSPTGATARPSACAVYDTNSGTQVANSLLSSPSWSGAAGSGWIRAPLTGGPLLAAGTKYTAGIFAAPGVNWFSATSGYWIGGGPGQNGLTSGIITAPNNANAVHGQDPDNSGVAIAFPATSSAGFNFWADIEVTTPPLVLAAGGGMSMMKRSLLLADL